MTYITNTQDQYRKFHTNTEYMHSVLTDLQQKIRRIFDKSNIILYLVPFSETYFCIVCVAFGEIKSKNFLIAMSFHKIKISVSLS